MLSIIVTSSFTCSAEQSASSVDNATPVIFVSGFAGTMLAKRNSDGTAGDVVFPPATGTILSLAAKYIPRIFFTAFTFKGIPYDFEPLEVNVSEFFKSIAEPIRMNSDGTSYYDLIPVLSGAANTSLAAFKAHGNMKKIPYIGSEFLDMQSIGAKIGDDRVFNFLYDWRKSHDTVADELRNYIEEVLALTGSEKVSIYSISQGSLVVGQYLYKYAVLGYVDNCVFNTPIFAGSSFIADLFSPDDYYFNYKTILDLVSELLHIETDLWSIVGDILPWRWLEYYINYNAKNVILPLVAATPAFWEMCPTDKFDRLVDLYTDKSDFAATKAQVLQTQNEFISHISDTFDKAEAFGAKLSIVACSGIPVVTGSDCNSDGIVDVSSSCGAICAPLGESFPADYEQLDKSYPFSISPDNSIDLSCGYIPERTWIIDRHFHGMAEWDPQSYALLTKLLLTDEISDAYSASGFPQFMTSKAPNCNASVYFTSSGCCTFSVGERCTVTIENLSRKHLLFIRSLEVDGGTIKINGKVPKLLLPGRTVEIEFTVNSAGCGTFNLKYVTTKTPFEHRHIASGFTVS